MTIANRLASQTSLSALRAQQTPAQISTHFIQPTDVPALSESAPPLSRQAAWLTLNHCVGVHNHATHLHDTAWSHESGHASLNVGRMMVAAALFKYVAQTAPSLIGTLPHGQEVYDASRTNRGCALRDLGHVRKAIVLLGQVMRDQHAKTDIRETHTALILAHLYWRQGDRDSAADIAMAAAAASREGIRRTSRIWQQRPLDAKEWWVYMMSCQNLAGAAQALGHMLQKEATKLYFSQPNLAEFYYQRAAEIWRNLLGEDHPETSTALARAHHKIARLRFTEGDATSALHFARSAQNAADRSPLLSLPARQCITARKRRYHTIVDRSMPCASAGSRA